MAIALLIPPTAQAQDFRIIGQAPHCNATIIHGPNDRGASSAAPQGRPVILYDVELMATLPYDRQFVLAHECGHHVLDHTSPEGLLREGHLFQEKELAADCWAAQALTEAGEHAVVDAQIAQWAALDTERAGPRYPTWARRIAELRRCAG